ncbi:hypothetical protein WG66_011179 [Moniliophthora roreri]|nr:hypothetical protein WG66_011179 [Moniliophthora roreri]
MKYTFILAIFLAHNYAVFRGNIEIRNTAPESGRDGNVFSEETVRYLASAASIPGTGSAFNTHRF